MFTIFDHCPLIVHTLSCLFDLILSFIVVYDLTEHIFLYKDKLLQNYKKDYSGKLTEQTVCRIRGDLNSSLVYEDCTDFVWKFNEDFTIKL